MRMFRRLVPRDPALDPQAAARLARSYSNLGLWAERSGFGGVRWTRRAVRIWEKLYGADPEKAEHSIGLAQSHMMLASRLLDQGRPRGAYKAAETAHSCYLQLPEEQRPGFVDREIGTVVQLLERLEREGYGDAEIEAPEAPKAPEPRSTRVVIDCGAPALTCSPAPGSPTASTCARTMPSRPRPGPANSPLPVRAPRPWGVVTCGTTATSTPSCSRTPTCG